MRKRSLVFLLCALMCMTFVGCSSDLDVDTSPNNVISTEMEDDSSSTEENGVIFLDNIPEYTGEPYVEINGNIPFFTDDEITTESYEYYSELDSFGRCGVTMACVGQDLMPTEERGEIGMVKPSGWNQEKYPGLVDGNYLYNRCHLIGYQLTGENATVQNLITGCRAFNLEMIPFENEVAEYVRETGNHVMYRVTPIFDGDNLLASGVLMEAQSVETDDVCYNVFLYNVQPGVEIDYATGENWLADEDVSAEGSEGTVSPLPEDGQEVTYVLNRNSMKFHEESCNSVDDMSEENKEVFEGNRDYLISIGYEPCGYCNP